MSIANNNISSKKQQDDQIRLKAIVQICGGAKCRDGGNYERGFGIRCGRNGFGS